MFVLSVKKRRGNYSLLWEWLSEKGSCLPKRLPQHRGSHFVFRNSLPERRKSYVDIFKLQGHFYVFLQSFNISLQWRTTTGMAKTSWTIIFNFGLVYLETYVHLLKPCYSNYFLDFPLKRLLSIMPVTNLNYHKTQQYERALRLLMQNTTSVTTNRENKVKSKVDRDASSGSCGSSGNFDSLLLSPRKHITSTP